MKLAPKPMCFKLFMYLFYRYEGCFYQKIVTKKRQNHAKNPKNYKNCTFYLAKESLKKGKYYDREYGINKLR